MKDWVGLLTAVIQLVTAVMLFRVASQEKNKKGTKKRRAPRKRK
ncbi:hypothetical protein [Paenibacillus pinihumi]|nr:hypothetical protein [Paenibacillus pinihumi]